MNSSESIIKAAVRSNTRKVLHVLGAMLGMLLLCVSAFSQGSNGRIDGTVTAANGRAVTGATVTVLDVQRGTMRPLTTDESRAYNAPNLTPGTYKVRANLTSFKTTER